MSRFLSGYWLLVPLLLVAILVRNYVEAPDTLVLDEPLTMQDMRADYYLEDFTTRRFDADGRLEYRLTGDTLSHYPDDGRAEIEQPRLTMRQPEAVWTMRAGSGRLTRRPDVVTLLDDVFLERASLIDEQAGPLRLSTSDLSVELASRDVRTSQPVRIEAPGLQLEAIGLQSSMAAGKLELLSNVTGRYDVATPDDR